MVLRHFPNLDALLAYAYAHNYSLHDIDVSAEYNQLPLPAFNTVMAAYDKFDTFTLGEHHVQSH